MLVISFGQGFEKNSEYDLQSLSLMGGNGNFSIYSEVEYECHCSSC